MTDITEKAKGLGLFPERMIPNSRQLEWYSRERSAFVHFGINTFYDNEWGDGTEDPAMFAPSELDCRQWIRVLKDAGFKIAILTAKHHDGFCLWQTATTEHSIKNSPYKGGNGDIVREFTDACREFGMKAGIYLSPWDRHEKCWGSDAYNDFYIAQLTELMSNYGEIYECWWDGAGSEEAHYDWERWVDVVRKLQPNAVIFGSLKECDVRWVGNEKGIAGDPCFATVKLSSLEREITAELNSGDPEGECFIPAEADVSVRPGWFYHADQDDNVRTPENLARLYFSSVGRNCGLLLNLPPDKRGLIHENDISALKGFDNILAESFENNLAEKAKISASSERSPLCPARAAVDGNIDSFYSPTDDDKCPELVFDFEDETDFNCFVLSEVIELGHKIRGFELSALVAGEWKKLAAGECVGNKYAAFFDNVRCKKVKLKITRASATPLIRNFGLYSMRDISCVNIKNGYKGKDLAKSRSAHIEKDEAQNEIFLQLGGIRPFNLIKVRGEGVEKCLVYVFNGSSFDYAGEAEIQKDGALFAFSKIVDWSYRIKLKLFGNADFSLQNCSLSLFCSE